MYINIIKIENILYLYKYVHKNPTNMSDLFYDLPLWLQIYYQIEKNTYIRALLRKTLKSLNDKLLLTKDDYNHVNSQLKVSWYRTNKDYVLIADDSDEGNRIYDYYITIYHSSLLFLKTNFILFK